jgi:membrane protein involved in colicin uptake
MTRFSKVYQLLTVVLVIAIANIYVLGAPVRSTDPKKADAPATTETKADVAGAEIAATPAVAAEKLPLAPNAKIDFNRIFAKSEIKAHASASHTFFNAKVSGRDTFKSPPRTGNPPQNNGGDTDGSNATWATVGVIAAVLSVVVIVLRTRRDNQN